MSGFGNKVSEGEDSTDEKELKSGNNLQNNYAMLSKEMSNANIANIECPSSEDENDFLAADDLNEGEDFEFDNK